MHSPGHSGYLNYVLSILFTRIPNLLIHLSLYLHLIYYTLSDSLSIKYFYLLSFYPSILSISLYGLSINFFIFLFHLFLIFPTHSSLCYSSYSLTMYTSILWLSALLSCMPYFVYGPSSDLSPAMYTTRTLPCISAIPQTKQGSPESTTVLSVQRYSSVLLDVFLTILMIE